METKAQDSIIRKPSENKALNVNRDQCMMNQKNLEQQVQFQKAKTASDRTDRPTERSRTCKDLKHKDQEDVLHIMAPCFFDTAQMLLTGVCVI